MKMIIFFISVILAVNGTIVFANEDGRKALGNQIKAMISDLSCDDSSQCKSIGFGSRECGGYQQFLIYSDKNVNESDLEQKAQKYFELDNKFNKEMGMASICSVEQPKISKCIRGVCEDMGDELNFLTPIHWAVLKKDFELIEILLKDGESIDALNAEGQTALQYAVTINNISQEMIQFLIEKGANVNVRGKSQNTPLLLAVINNKFEIVKILLKNGADQNIKNHWGTPLEYARNLKYEQIIKLLESYPELGTEP